MPIISTRKLSIMGRWAAMKYTQGYLKGLEARVEANDLSSLGGATVLITGASGLIGSALADVLLCANHMLDLNLRLVFAGRNHKALNERFAFWDNSTWDYARFNNRDSVDFDFKADYIVHCAGIAHPAAYNVHPAEVITGNIIGTAGILDYARSCGVKRVLYLSSSEVYGSRDGMEPYKETDQYPVSPLSPRSCYPSSKRTCETLCVSYLSEYSVDSVIVRPGHVWGPMATMTDSRAHAQFARNAAAGCNIIMKSPGSQLRSYIYGIDCAGALLAVLQNGKAGEAYNVGVPGFACTIRQLADALADAGGVHVIHDYPTAEEAAGYNPMTCSALDCSKLAELNFKALFSLEDAAYQTIDCLR